MSTQVHCVSPDLGLVDLERAFLEQQVSGFPVVQDDRLVGIVSRSDVVRQLCVEESRAELLSDYYVDLSGFSEPLESLQQLGRRVGARVETLTVEDVMIREIVSVAPDTPLRELAALLVDRHIHRVPVVADGRLVGLVSSLDLVRLVAERGLRAP